MYCDTAERAGIVTVDLAAPLIGISSPGQFAVFYDDDECIASSTILRKDKNHNHSIETELLERQC